MTAIVYSGTLRYFRQKSRRVTRSRWKGAIAWYCVLAIGGFFALNWIYQVIRKPGEIFAPVSASLSKSPGDHLAELRITLREAFYKHYFT